MTFQERIHEYSASSLTLRSQNFFEGRFHASVRSSLQHVSCEASSSMGMATDEPIERVHTGIVLPLRRLNPVLQEEG